jgi:hypothetical protein
MASGPGNTEKYINFRGYTWKLRVIHAWLDFDDAKEAMAKQYDALTREELDSHHSGMAKPCAFEIIASKYNDKSWKPDTSTYPDLHNAFAEPVDCSWRVVKRFGPMSADKVKDLMLTMRCRLNQIVPKWEDSGRGEGSRSADQTDAFMQDDQANGDLPEMGSENDKYRFLCGLCVSHLYLWEKSLEFDVFHTVMQRLGEDTSCNSGAVLGSVSSRTGTKKRKHAAKEEEVDTMVADNIRASSEAFQNYNVELMTRTLEDLEQKLLDAEDRSDLLEDQKVSTRLQDRQKVRVKLLKDSIKNQSQRLEAYLKSVSKIG